LFACVAGVGVLDVEGGEEVGGGREVDAEVGVAELVGLTELDADVGACSGYY